MWRGGLSAGNGVATVFLRHFSRKRAPNLRKINPKVPPQEAATIAESLYHVIQQHGPLTFPNTWNLAKEANISGLNSKTHMKLMLKWMRGRNMLKQFCHQVGSSKKFMLSALPEVTQINTPIKGKRLP
ncbi:hypothetical protein HAX54_009331 [Datura stramonium]|uniref:Uncharacterized protein n=1 Tax=Datura stramonium TaxID=4076 RepID=A0ABS8TGD8_DATST|nr:hypothetical protein [Datura stramonium]